MGILWFPVGVSVGLVATLLGMYAMRGRWLAADRLPYEPPAITDFGGGEYPSRAETMMQMRLLREYMERPGGCGMSHERAFLLHDICAILGYTEAETQSIMGFSWWLVDTPVAGPGVFDDL